MKKVICFMLFLFLISGWSSATASANHTVTLGNGKIVNDRVLVPLRSIFEALGANVEWDQKNQTITAYKDDKKITLKIGSKSTTVNNKTIQIDVAPQIEQNKTYVPLRFVSESLGANVEWDSIESEASISTAHTTIIVRVLSESLYSFKLKGIDGGTYDVFVHSDDIQVEPFIDMRTDEVTPNVYDYIGDFKIRVINSNGEQVAEDFELGYQSFTKPYDKWEYNTGMLVLKSNQNGPDLLLRQEWGNSNNQLVSFYVISNGHLQPISVSESMVESMMMVFDNYILVHDIKEVANLTWVISQRTPGEVPVEYKVQLDVNSFTFCLQTDMTNFN